MSDDIKRFKHQEANILASAIFFNGNNQENVKKLFGDLSETIMLSMLDLKYKNKWLIKTDDGLCCIYDDDNFKKSFKEVGCE